MPRPLRFIGAAVGVSLVVAAWGIGWEYVRFGTSSAETLSKLEREVREQLDTRANRIEALAREAVANPRLIAEAVSTREALPTLFDALTAAVPESARETDSVTIYIPERGGYTVLAWSDGPAGHVSTDLLAGRASHFVARGSAGLRLGYVLPIEAGGRSMAVAVAESVLAPVTQTETALLPTSFGPVTLVPPRNAGASALPPGTGFVIDAPEGGPLVEVHYAPADPALKRAELRRRTLALAGVPLVGGLLVLIGPLLDRRRRTAGIGAWIAWSALAVAVVVAAAWSLAGLSRMADLAAGLPGALAATATAASVAILPGGWWWRGGRREVPSASPVRFAVEQLIAGVLIAAAITGINALLSGRMTPERLSGWRSALFPMDAAGLVEIWTLLLVVLAIGWALAALLGSLSARWRLVRDPRARLAAVVLWLAPLAVVLAPAVRDVVGPLPAGASLGFAAAFLAFGLGATAVRRSYRRTTQSMRLLLAFAALLLPILAVYPTLAVLVDRATRTVIERDYAPETASQPDEIRKVLLRTQDEIDRLDTLPQQLRSRAGQPVVDSQTAFAVWSQTSLSTTRVISDVELYGPDRALLSRFTLNLPDYVYRASARTWEGSGCDWEVSGDVTRFAGTDRTMLHAQRGLCDSAGELAGAIVLHVAPADYRALPFLAAPSAYSAVLATDDAPRRPALPGLEVVVYGWSLQPLFTANDIAWPLTPALFERLYEDGASFWTRLDTEGRGYDVYLTQNRAGIYALGYPTPTAFEHAARLGEIVAVTAALFVLLQLAAVIYAPLMRRPNAPLRVLIHEVRTSFYRKLFLFFVLVAIGPVFLFTIAFGAYMTAKFRADVEAEAETIVTAARRVFELVAAEELPGQPVVALSDDLMVWVRQLINQDVNLFEGSELVATSQRDLYNSGLLPTRTPAVLYRRIALERLPTFVAEDRQNLVAASRLPVAGPDAVLSVPLAPRQREIEQEIDELYRGVLVGAVFVVLFAAGLGAWMASRVSDPVARLTKATRQIAAGRLDVRIAADTADELRRLVDDFNTMTATLVSQRAELARTNQLKAWNEMARQVAHEIKNPLTPIQLAAEHLQRVHADERRPLGPVFDQCLDTILGQVRLLRRIASDFANFAVEEKPRPETIDVGRLIEDVVGPYRLGLGHRVRIGIAVPADLPATVADRTMVQRALTNLVENAIQAMPAGGDLQVAAHAEPNRVVLTVADTGVGMDAAALARAFEPYFSTKTGGSGLGLANARRTIELQGGTISLASEQGGGTTVTITLPVAPRGEPAIASVPSR